MPSQKKFKIILGVTGGIAAYKACELTRIFKRAGHEVRVVMSAAAEDFVAPLTFHSLSGEPVLRSLREGAKDLSATSHIDLAQWGEILVVAPATANFMAKFTHGAADDALLTEALAFRGPILLAPAMNTRMWEGPATLENLEILLSRGIYCIGPEEGDLACGETGSGKMSEPQDIAERALAILSQGLPLQGKKILITSGPTRSYIDSVRFLSNRSSGRMGHSIAMAAEQMGAEVILVTGPVEDRFSSLRRGKVIKVETGEQMLEACGKFLPDSHALFATAAVADFRMPEVFAGKIRREGELSLQMVPAVDVLAELARQKKDGQIFFGFAAEAGEGEKEFAKGLEKIQRKNLDFLALNNISRSDIGFDSLENEVFLFQKDGSKKLISKRGKSDLANQLLREAFSR